MGWVVTYHGGVLWLMGSLGRGGWGELSEQAAQGGSMSPCASSTSPMIKHQQCYTSLATL